jgi:hypothetical protein
MKYYHQKKLCIKKIKLKMKYLMNLIILFTIGMKSFLHTFEGAPHVPFSPGIGSTQSSTAYMDTTENLLNTFLFDDIKTPGVGVNNILTKNDVSVFPNPTKENVSIEISKGKINTIVITDITGKVMETIVAKTNIIDLNLNELNSGIYFLTISNELGIITKKMIKE